MTNDKRQKIFLKKIKDFNNYIILIILKLTNYKGTPNDVPYNLSFKIKLIVNNQQSIALIFLRNSFVKIC